MIQPVMFLSVAGIVLAVVAILRLSFMPAFIVGVGDFLYALMQNGIINNLAVIFCIGLTCALAKKQKTDAAVIGIVSFLVFLVADNYWLQLTGRLIDSDVLTGTGQGMVLGIQVVDMGVFGGIIIGCVNAWVFNHFCDVKFPDAVRVYGGTRLVFLLVCVSSALIGIVASYVWPTVSGALSSIQGFIMDSGYIGLFVYGFLNRILIPTGLHHLVYMPFCFTSVGGVIDVAGQAIQGASPIYMTEMAQASTITALDPSIRYMLFGFSKIFGSIGTVLAFIATAKPEKKNEARAMLIPACVTAVVAGITEPLEFMYLFVSPLLFAVHSVLDGLFQVIVYAVGYNMSLMSATDIITGIIVFPWDLTHWYVLIPIGIIAIIVWFVAFRVLILKFDLKTPGREDDEADAIDLSKMNRKSLEAQKKGGAAKASAGTEASEQMGDVTHIIEGLGGPDNIVSIMNCFTRLRVDLKDINKLNEDEINKFPNRGIVKGKESVQIIIGMKVQDVCEAVNDALGREME